MTIKIHGKDYKTVVERVNEFRNESKDWGIETELVHIDDLSVVVKAIIKNPEGRVIASDYAEEVRANGNINKTSALENCSTSAIGRALAAYGLGGTEYASANEVSNAIIQQNVKQATDEIIRGVQAIRENMSSILAIKEAFAEEEYSAVVEAWEEVSDEDRGYLTRAPSKGGVWTTEEVKKFKSNEYAEARKLVNQ